MPTEYKIYNVAKEDLYASKSKEEREKIRKEMVAMARVRGNKPTARYFNTYPSTVRRWVQKEDEKLKQEQEKISN